jgi:YihY family inner membrane protein
VRRLRALDRAQQRYPAVAFVVAVAQKFSEDGASRLGSLIAFWAFFSLFPLLLAFVAILGFVFESDESLRSEAVDSILSRIPTFGDEFARQIGHLSGSGVALTVGLLGALYGGLGVMNAVGFALDEVWGVPHGDRPDAVRRRGRSLLMLAVIGTAIVASTVGLHLARVGGIQPATVRILDAVAAAALAALVFLLGFKVLTAAKITLRQALPGVAVATVGWVGLQLLGSLVIAHALKRADLTYGAFAAVFGVLSWMLLGAQLLMVAAEVSVVKAHRLWPRSLFGEHTEADIRALRRLAHAQRRWDEQTIKVSFSDEEGSDR